MEEKENKPNYLLRFPFTMQNKWEEVYSSRLIGFLLKNDSATELDFIELLIENHDVLKTKRLTDDELVKKIKDVVFRNKFDELDEFHLSGLEHQLSRYRAKQEKEIRIEERFAIFLRSKKMRLGGTTKKANRNTFEGKKFNISERYELFRKVFKGEKKLRRLNCSAEDKHTLLALIFDCNKQTARELFNGTQQKRTKVREDLLNRYINSLR